MQRFHPVPGFLGISYGDMTTNAIIWGMDGEFYFYVVSRAEAAQIEEWHQRDTLEDCVSKLAKILPRASNDDLSMFCWGM